MEFSGTIFMVYPSEQGIQKVLLKNIWSRDSKVSAMFDRLLLVYPTTFKLDLLVDNIITARGYLEPPKHNTYSLLVTKEKQKGEKFFLRYSQKVHTFQNP
jgi:hypothetical protein